MLHHTATLSDTGRDPDCLARPSARVEEFVLVEDYLCAYLDDPAFARRYPLAHESWSRTWATLWRADSAARVIAVARCSRETMWCFACALVRWHAPDTAVPRPDESLLRAWEVIEIYRPQLGDERLGLLGVLFENWQAQCAVVQRYEHPATAACERLHWEDGRRTALLSALLMVEIDRSI